MLFIKHHHFILPTDTHKHRKLLPWWDCPGGQPHTQRKMSDSIVSRFQFLVACSVSSSVSYFRRTMWLVWTGRIFSVGEERRWGSWEFGGFCLFSVCAVEKFCLFYNCLEIQILFWESDSKRDLSGAVTLPGHGAQRYPWCDVAVSCISEVNNTTANLKGISICFHIT